MALNPPRDPLLTIARLVTTLLVGLFAVCTAAVLLGALVLLLVPSLGNWLSAGQLAAQLSAAEAKTAAALLSPGALVIEGVILLIVAAMLAASCQFVRQLRRIIDSVGAGDPFTPANASRLTQMAWLLVGIELASLPLEALADWLGKRVHQGDLTVDMGVSVGNLIVAVVLFILAQVFREGTRLRDEVEGTV